MSCDVTKLEYLNETKQMLREKIDPDGKKITDEMPFRDYVNFISSNSVGNSFIIINLAGASVFGNVEELEV